MGVPIHLGLPLSSGLKHFRQLWGNAGNEELDCRLSAESFLSFFALQFAFEHPNGLDAVNKKCMQPKGHCHLYVSYNTSLTIIH